MDKDVRFRQSICVGIDFYDKKFCDTFPHPVIVGGEKEISNSIKNGDVIVCWGDINLNSMNLPTSISCVFNACAEVRSLLESCDKYVNHVIACSTRVASTVCYDKPHTVILPGIDVKRLMAKESRLKKRLSLKIGDDDFLVGMIARIDDQKQQQMLVDAMKKIQDPNIKAIFVGSGPKMNYLIDENISNCLFVGHQTNIGEWWNILDCYCLLSTSEGCSASLFEAMFCEIPIITTLVGSVDDILDKYSAIMISDINELIEAIYKIKNDGIGSSMVKVAKEKFYQYGDIEHTAKSWEKLIKRLTCTKKLFI